MEVISLQPNNSQRQVCGKKTEKEKGGVSVTTTRIKGGIRGKPCICGLCNCNKKHKCPVHYHLVPPNYLLPSSEYYTIYCNDTNKDYTQQHGTIPHGPQRGIKLYPRILPTFPKTKLESITVYDRAFPDPGRQKLTENLKPDDTYVKSNAKFYDETSYKAEFFEHPLTTETNSTRQEEKEAREEEEPLILPSVQERTKLYETSNKRFYPRWTNTKDCRPLPYGEPMEEPFFTGSFNDETVTTREFYSKVAEPRVTCYPIEYPHIPEGTFADKVTTTKDTFTLPSLVEREGPFLKNNSKRSEATIVIKENTSTKDNCNNNLTQYQRDNRPFKRQPEKRKMKPPYMETISLSSMPHYKLPQITNQKMSYPNWGRQQVPESLKREDENELPTGPFIDVTEYKTRFVQPSQIINNDDDKIEERSENRSETKSKNKESSTRGTSCDSQKSYVSSKQVQRFEKVPFPISVNQSEYFQFYKTRPRHRHGDKAERLYAGPSSAKFGCPTKYELDFPPKIRIPSKCYKPVEKIHVSMAKFKGITSYTDDYPQRPLPIRSACPAGQILALQPFY